MSRPIDADKLLDKLKKTDRYFMIKFDVEEMPTVELRTPDKWIPCSERLPEEDDLTQVLVSVNERYAVYKIILMPSKSVKTEYKLGHIDAWMPLPEPYRNC